MACSHVKSCELFVQFALNPALDIWKRHYCEGNFSSCARYQQAKTGRQIPLTLLPNGVIIHSTVNDKHWGTTAIFNAIMKNRLHMMRSLSKIGIDVNVRNIDGQTALMAAAECGHKDIVLFLLDMGADLQAMNDFGQNVLDVARERGRQDIVDLLESRGATATAA